MPKHVKGAKIALLDFNLQKHRMGLGVSIVVTDPKKVEEIKQRFETVSSFSFSLEKPILPRRRSV